MRSILAVLIVISLAFAPVASALAAGHGGEMAGMEDCHKQTPASAGCQCCDAKLTCPEQVCLLKCFKLLGDVRPATRLVVLVPEPVLLGITEKPPDWASKPPIPPPRS